MTDKEKETLRIFIWIEIIVLSLLLLAQLLVRIDVLEKKMAKAESNIRIIKTDIDIINNGFEAAHETE